MSPPRRLCPVNVRISRWGVHRPQPVAVKDEWEACCTLRFWARGRRGGGPGGVGVAQPRARGHLSWVGTLRAPGQKRPVHGAAAAPCRRRGCRGAGGQGCAQAGGVLTAATDTDKQEGAADHEGRVSTMGGGPVSVTSDTVPTEMTGDGGETRGGALAPKGAQGIRTWRRVAWGGTGGDLGHKPPPPQHPTTSQPPAGRSMSSPQGARTVSCGSSSFAPGSREGTAGGTGAPRARGPGRGHLLPQNKGHAHCPLSEVIRQVARREVWRPHALSLRGALL